MKIKRTWLVSILFITNIAGAQTLQQNIQKAFTRLQQDSQCRYASVSLTVLDAKTGEQVFAANPDMGLAPGSTLKTVTSITAFNVLGKDFQFQTQLGYTGTIVLMEPLPAISLLKAAATLPWAVGVGHQPAKALF
jgi:D-alanyl-D-alanine carboxypeptidase/D-alanyl-D-alanine-endopeptidase (penicillin-binding protein 4)